MLVQLLARPKQPLPRATAAEFRAASERVGLSPRELCALAPALLVEEGAAEAVLAQDPECQQGGALPGCCGGGGEASAASPNLETAALHWGQTARPASHSLLLHPAKMSKKMSNIVS